MQPVRRPHSVTIVAWLFIISGLFYGALIPLSYMAVNDETARAELLKQSQNDPNFAKLLEQISNFTIGSVAFGVGVCMLYILGGVYMVQGARWARRLSIGLLLLGTATTSLNAPSFGSLIIVAFFTLLLTYGLVRKPANDFFEAESNPPTRP
jgi:hypothetical protein